MTTIIMVDTGVRQSAIHSAVAKQHLITWQVIGILSACWLVYWRESPTVAIGNVLCVNLLKINQLFHLLQ
jgi:hypothetical protein